MDWSSIGGGAISAGIGTALGLIGNIGAAKRQRKAIEAQKNAQKELNEQAASLNYEYGEKAAENAYQRQLAMYNRSYGDQSYKAMVKQMEEAGLSVGLMYGGSGSGGGAGVETNKKGGRSLRIKCEEPSLIIALSSYVPRVDYSQGNKWWVS